MSAGLPNLSVLSLHRPAAQHPAPTGMKKVQKQKSGDDGGNRPGGGVSQRGREEFKKQRLVEVPTTDDSYEELGSFAGFLDEVGQAAAVLASSTEEPCFSLVDGRNVLWNDTVTPAVRQAKRCVPPSGSQVVVVLPKFAWEAMGMDERGRDGSGKRRNIARLFDPLRARGTKVLFALLVYDKIADVDGSECYGYPDAQGTCRSRPTKMCKLENMQYPSHLACELDDVLLTELHCELTKSGRAVKVVSDDRKVLKTNKEVADLRKWVRNAPLRVDLEIVAVNVN